METILDENVIADGTAFPEAKPEAEDTASESVTEEAEIGGGVPDACAELGEFFPGITEESADAVCNLERYRQLRALGLSTEEAYRATARQRAQDSRSHLSGAVGSAAPPRRGGISEQELRSARELLGDISDAEIRRLYKRVNA